MELFYPIIALLIIEIIAGALLANKKKESNNDANVEKCTHYPYEKKHLLTNTEYKFYKELKEKCNEKNILICPKVRMEDFLKVTEKKAYMKYRGYIKSRHIDFILCNSDLQIIAGLELDDNSHNTKKAQQTDKFKNNVFQKIGIPLHRVKTSKNGYEQEINSLIEKLSL